MTFRFIHTSDLHLGRRFANIPQAQDSHVRGRLMEARFASINRLSSAALEAGAKHILLAGDTFDTATPSPSVVRQALGAMSEANPIQWWLLPGNHDNLSDAEALWTEIANTSPDNVHPIFSANAIELEEDVFLLPCPLEFRSIGRDPTEHLAKTKTPPGALRIGLAHGGIVDFGGTGASITVDRAETANLDYLALGDWHGRVSVSDRTHYSGSPEQDRFKHHRKSVCLSVALEDAGSIPNVEEITTGAFFWYDWEVSLHDEFEIETALKTLENENARRDTLIRIKPTGWASLATQSKFQSAINHVSPEFAYLSLDMSGVQTLYEDADLDEIDQAGALRLAAESLKNSAEDETSSDRDRQISKAALARLYAYIKEDDQ